MGTAVSKSEPYDSSDSLLKTTLENQPNAFHSTLPTGTTNEPRKRTMLHKGPRGITKYFVIFALKTYFCPNLVVKMNLHLTSRRIVAKYQDAWKFSQIFSKHLGSAWSITRYITFHIQVASLSAPVDLVESFEYSSANWVSSASVHLPQRFPSSRNIS